MAQITNTINIDCNIAMLVSGNQRTRLHDLSRYQLKEKPLSSFNPYTMVSYNLLLSKQ